MGPRLAAAPQPLSGIEGRGGETPRPPAPRTLTVPGAHRRAHGVRSRAQSWPRLQRLCGPGRSQPGGCLRAVGGRPGSASTGGGQGLRPRCGPVSSTHPHSFSGSSTDLEQQFLNIQESASWLSCSGEPASSRWECLAREAAEPRTAGPSFCQNGLVSTPASPGPGAAAFAWSPLQGPQHPGEGGGRACPRSRAPPCRSAAPC